jgi:membrane protease YdiL (CAAX protease family)
MLLEFISRDRAVVHLLVLLGVVAALTLGLLLVQAGASAPADHTVEDTVLTETWKLVSLAVNLLPWIVMIAVTRNLLRQAGGGWAAMGLTRRELGSDLLLGLPVAVASYAAYFAAVGLLLLVWPDAIKALETNSTRIKDVVPDVHFFWLLLIMVAVAVTEETIFRGIVLTHLRRITGSWTVATLVSAVVFAVPHVISQEMVVVVVLIPVAVVWSAVTIWRRSLVPCIVGHCLFNFVQVVWLYHFSRQ